MTTTNFLFTDADLIASFSGSQIARRQYTVLFVDNDYTMSMLVWADNKKEANKLAREYCARILNCSFKSIMIEA